MKYVIYPITAVLLLSILFGCANGRKVAGESPVPLKEPYYTTWKSGLKDGASGFTLVVPVKSSSEIVFDSVYFRGRGAEFHRSQADPRLFLAYFSIPQKEGAPDIIMHKDPKKEYGNPAPVLPPEIPFELDEGEAVVRYTRNGEPKYFRIQGIRESDHSGADLKRPENIRH